MHPRALAALNGAGVPSFRTPEACADVIAAALKRRAPRPPPFPPHQAGARKGEGVARAHTSPGRMLDERDAGTLLGRMGIPRTPTVVIDASTARAPTLPFPYPVAVKALSAEIAHKTEVGGVVLNVNDGAELIAAVRQIRADVAARTMGKRVQRVLVQPMVRGVGEVLVGYRVDADAGPLVLVAAGGVLTEIYRDRSLRLAPVESADAFEMIDEVRALATLKGYRGMPPGDLDALAQAIVAMSQFALEPSVAEAEINPLIVCADGEGVVAVDALVKLM